MDTSIKKLSPVLLETVAEEGAVAMESLFQAFRRVTDRITFNLTVDRLVKEGLVLRDQGYLFPLSSALAKAA